MTTEVKNKKGEFIIRFDNFFGSGWDDDLEKIIKNSIKPNNISKNVIKADWGASEIEFMVEKEVLKFLLHLDDEGPNCLKLLTKSTEENKQKLRDFATIIDTEVELLKG